MTMHNPVGKRPSIASTVAFSLSAWHDQAARIFNLDLLAILIAILLPWTTSGVAILAVTWVVALIPSLDWRAFARSLKRPICTLPIALFALAAVGTLWSDAPWETRLFAVSPTVKLLMLPLLFHHYERSTRGIWVFTGFLASCVLLMTLSWIVAFDQGLALKADATYGVPVKNYIDQSQEFALCAVALAYPVITLLRAGKIRLAAALAAVALSFVVNMTFVTVSRTALVTIPVMLAAFALLHLKWRTSLAIFVAGILLATLAWATSPKLQWTTETFYRDYYFYKLQDEPTSIGIRLEFWKKSLRFFADAPIAGHGTGSTRGLFEQAASDHRIGKIFASAQVIGNPHNQTLNVAVQWGIVGVVTLYAMWLYHLSLFRGEGLVAWIGLLVAVQNIFTSLFNSHVFDFHEGWMYVLGVGIAGGTVLARGGAPPARKAPPDHERWHAQAR
jgi:O-antigen ligase